MMNKYLKRIVFLSVIALTQTLSAQMILNEDFNGTTPLSNWTLINNDNLTPANAVNYVTAAWVIREDFDTTGVGDNVAVSTSWYTPAGAADDYLVTPSISTGSGTVLEWDAKAQDPAFPDGYEVRISTTGPTTAGFLANPALYSTTAENASWTRRTLNLSAYPNQTVHIAFRNNSNDMFLLLIDNVKIFNPASDDASISGLISPAESGCNFGSADSVRVRIRNNGSNVITSLTVGFQLNSSAVISETYTGSISPGGTATYTFQTATVNLSAVGNYTLKTFTSLANDGNTSNDTLTENLSNNPVIVPYTENFDALSVGQSGQLSNGWSTTATGAFSWFSNSGTTTTTNSGPNGDNTSGSGIYMYTEASTPAAPGETATLTSPCLDLSSNPNGLTMEFFYHAYGADITTLYVDVDTNGVWTRVDSIVGQQQNSSSATYNSRVVSLSSFLNASTMRVRFVTDRGASFDGDIAIDDVSFYEPQALDLELSSLSVPQIVNVNTVVPINGDLRNIGLNAVTSVVVNWSINQGTVNKDTLNINLSSGSSQSFIHNINWTPNTAGLNNNLSVWISEPNFQIDGNPSNDSLSQSIVVSTGNSVQKMSLLEQFTTAVCQFCPDGAWVTAQIHNNYQNVEAVSVHSCFGTDAMTNSEASDLCSTLGINSAPTAMVDRKLYAGETDVAFGRGQGYPNWSGSTWAQRSLAQSQAGSAVDINLTGSYNPANRSLSANIDASFVDYIAAGDIRVSLMLVEDSVTGTGNGYNQVNAYNTQTGHPFAGQGNPIVGYNHKRVMRDIWPNTWGDASVIPTTYALNTTYSKSFTQSIPASFDDTKLSLIAIVSYFGGSSIGEYEVLNIESVDLNNLITSIPEQTSINESLTIYPNPSSFSTNLEFRLDENKAVNLQVLDITGKVMISENYGSMAQGKQKLNLDVSGLSNGFYFINLNVDGEVISRKISVMN